MKKPIVKNRIAKFIHLDCPFSLPALVKKKSSRITSKKDAR
jgi:hypothetical protein